MTIGILKLELFIQNSNSLKEKRMVLHALKARLRSSFNVSLSQIGAEDKWQKTVIAVAGVERDRKCMNSALSGVLNFIEQFKGVEIMDHEMELI